MKKVKNAFIGGLQNPLYIDGLVSTSQRHCVVNVGHQISKLVLPLNVTIVMGIHFALLALKKYIKVPREKIINILL
jgi:hypothetical protein